MNKQNKEKQPIIDKHFYEVLEKMNSVIKLLNGVAFWKKEELLEMSKVIDKLGNGLQTRYFVFRKTDKYLWIRPLHEFKIRLGKNDK